MNKDQQPVQPVQPGQRKAGGMADRLPGLALQYGIVIAVLIGLGLFLIWLANKLL